MLSNVVCLGENDVPEIFILLVSYFDIQPTLMRSPGLFLVGGALDKMDELQIHLTMGNYFYLTEMGKEPNVAANFLKKVLSNMKEPLCTFDLYYTFKSICEIPKENRVEKIREACLKLPMLNRNTFVFLIEFFNRIVLEAEFNKVYLLLKTSCRLICINYRQ